MLLNRSGIIILTGEDYATQIKIFIMMTISSANLLHRYKFLLHKYYILKKVVN